jgi:hypothetical protein
MGTGRAEGEEIEMVKNRRGNWSMKQDRELIALSKTTPWKPSPISFSYRLN